MLFFLKNYKKKDVFDKNIEENKKKKEKQKEERAYNNKTLVFRWGLRRKK